MNKKLSRRDFIKLLEIGTIGAATMAFIPSIFRESIPTSQTESLPLNSFLHFDATSFGKNAGISHPLEFMEPINFVFANQIWGTSKKGERNRWEYWKQNKEKFASFLSKLPPKLPLSLDIEGGDPSLGFKNSAWYVDIRRKDSPKEIVEQYIQYRLEISDWVHSHYDGPVSHYSTWPLNAGTLTYYKLSKNQSQYSKHYSEWEQANEVLNPLRENQDFYTPYGYFSPESARPESNFSEVDLSVEHFKTYQDLVIATGKSLYPVVSPQYLVKTSKWFEEFIPAENLRELIIRWQNESKIPGVVWFIGSAWRNSDDTSQWKPWHDTIIQHKLSG